jgi:uncharacterized protein
MRRFFSVKLPLILLLSACVTVNVYFPAAAAEQAADKLINSITNSSDAPAAAPSATPPTGRASAPQSSLLVSFIGQTLDRLIPAAHAQANANLDISSPEIRAIAASMEKRFAQLESYFNSGAIGLTADGLIEVRDQNLVPLPQRATVKRLVAEDNTDRQALYAQIAKANGHPEWESDIRKTFARRWIDKGAKSGWFYQDAAGAWVKK